MPDSANLIADAVVAAIEGITALNTLFPGVVVKKLKTPSLPSGVNPPFIAVSVGEGGEEGQTEPIGAMYFPAPINAVKLAKINRFPTTVVIITSADGMILRDGEAIREARPLIEAAVGDDRTCFASVPGFNMVSTIGKAPFDGSLIPKDLDYSATGFNVEVIEPREA